MCDPVSMAVIAGASQALQIGQQATQARAQVKALEASTAAAQDEQAAATGQQMGERLRAARSEAARRVVAAGESGVAGASVAQELKTILGSGNQDLGILSVQDRFAQRAISAQARAQAASIDRPGLLGAGLQIASASLGGYSAGQGIQAHRSALSIPRPGP